MSSTTLLSASPIKMDNAGVLVVQCFAYIQVGWWPLVGVLEVARHHRIWVSHLINQYRVVHLVHFVLPGYPNIAHGDLGGAVLVQEGDHISN